MGLFGFGKKKAAGIVTGALIALSLWGNPVNAQNLSDADMSTYRIKVASVLQKNTEKCNQIPINNQC